MQDAWSPFEETLYRASAEQLKLFSELHANERFYGFTFDCNADYGEVLLCVNSEEGLRKTIHDHYSHYTEHEIARLRWNAGDWKYQGFNGYRGPLSSAWNRHWRREFKKLAGTSYEEWLHGVMADQVDEFSEHFMEAVCRTLVKMESGGEFEALLKSESFCTFVNDHDEVDETSWLRLAKVRLAMSPSFPATSLAGIRFTGGQRQLAQAYMAVCADLFDSGDSTTAWHLAAEALRLQPSLVETVKARATDEGEQPFRVDDVALPIAPKYVLASALLARTSHFVFGQGPDNRLADVDAALALVPDYEPALLERAELRHASACIDEGGGELLRQAVDDYSRILRARPNDLKVLRQRARAHVHGARRDYANALADYDRIMSLATPTAEDYSDRAWALQNLSRFEEAAADYTRAIELRGPPTGWNLGLRLDFRNRGKCSFRMGHYEDALADFVAAQEVQPRTGDELLLFQSQTLSKLGRMEEAEAVLQRARKRKPDIEQQYADWLIED